ncbi:hypothetical protein NV379_13495 [Paenibacillus sp. N1-5-1-14]|uniref:hypothetical protein n=1 Tax=Paenibacillus radicibacter TaxID=2972488 RepID=UPI002158F57A|nr:hypothetical protein [Paenibacillus radicibacter]MCR8643666.1 hypothetical protein [Paenibacillus radicibacter]
MEPTNNEQSKSLHLFSVEILLDAPNNHIAVEKLLHILNQAECVNDYKVISGIKIGNLVEQNRPQNNTYTALPISKPTTTITKTVATKPCNEEQHTSIINQMDQLKKSNTLVRFSVIKEKGVKLSIPCRILNYDPEQQNITIYHVDEKKVYLIQLNEIDDFSIVG